MSRHNVILSLSKGAPRARAITLGDHPDVTLSHHPNVILSHPNVTLSLSKGALIVAALAALALIAGVMRAPAGANEIALAQGTIAIHEAAAGEQSPACAQLTVEARDGLDNHFISSAPAKLAADGTCRYALSVPAQQGVWLRVRPTLVAGARVGGAALGSSGGVGAYRSASRVSSRAVQLRWTVIAPNTYFFAPNETKTVPLSY